MKTILLEIKTSIIAAIVLAIILCGLYPVMVWGLAQFAFPHKANGSLIESNDRRFIGSELLGQSFSNEKYFHPRPSAAGSGYDATSSGGTNFGPTNQKLIDRVTADVATAQAETPGKPIPADMVTTSASGLDPDITPASAEFQLPRISKARGMSEDAVRTLVAQHTQGRQWGFFGEPRVNVLELNLSLDS